MLKPGFIFIDKASGPSSFQIVKKLKRLTGLKSGHTGTLDPFAEGVLPIALGKATRLIEYVQSSRKGYIFTIKFGANTDSLDLTGEVVKESSACPNQEQLSNIIKKFTGKQLQQPPIFSALKVAGKAAYKYARAGEEVELKPRPIEIYSLELLEFNQDIARFNVTCSKGTYIRALARDICAELDCCGHVVFLRRTENAQPQGAKLLSSKALESISLTELESYIYEADKILTNLDSMSFSEHSAKLLKHGTKLYRNDLPFSINQVIKAKLCSKFFAVLLIKEAYIKPLKLLDNK